MAKLRKNDHFLTRIDGEVVSIRVVKGEIDVEADVNDLFKISGYSDDIETDPCLHLKTRKDSCSRAERLSDSHAS